MIIVWLQLYKVWLEGWFLQEELHGGDDNCLIQPHWKQLWLYWTVQKRWFILNSHNVPSVAYGKFLPPDFTHQRGPVDDAEHTRVCQDHTCLLGHTRSTWALISAELQALLQKGFQSRYISGGTKNKINSIQTPPSFLHMPNLAVLSGILSFLSLFIF